MIEAALNAAAEQVVEYGASGTDARAPRQPRSARRAAERVRVCRRRGVARASRSRPMSSGRGLRDAPRRPRMGTRSGARDRRGPPRRARPRSTTSSRAWCAPARTRGKTRRPARDGGQSRRATSSTRRDIAHNPQLAAPRVLRGRGPPGHGASLDPDGPLPLREPRRRTVAPPAGADARASTTVRSSVASSVSATTSSPALEADGHHRRRPVGT